MSSQTSGQRRTTRTDREYYAELWATGHGSVTRRMRLVALRQRSGYAVVVGALALLAYLALGPPPSPDEQVPVAGRHADADDVGRRQRTMSVVGELDTERAGAERPVARVEAPTDEPLAGDPRVPQPGRRHGTRGP